MIPSMNSYASAIEVLRAATRDAHRSLEQTLAITKPNASRTEYINYVAALYGWLSPFEAKLWSSSWPEGLNASKRQGKCAWLAEDLTTAGIDGTKIPHCGFAPDLSKLPSRIGIAYVIEGAQLGTKVLSKTLGPRLDGWAPRWLQGYGSGTAENWREFLVFIENTLQTKGERQMAATAAIAGFTSLATWFADCVPIIERPFKACDQILCV